MPPASGTRGSAGPHRAQEAPRRHQVPGGPSARSTASRTKGPAGPHQATSAKTTIFRTRTHRSDIGSKENPGVEPKQENENTPALQRATQHSITIHVRDTDHIEVSKPWASDSDIILSKPLRGAAISPTTTSKRASAASFF